MQVTLFPNSRRPGIGLRPKKEAQRPSLPQHSRLCPVLEAGSSLGYLIYPALAENEQFHIGYEGEGLFQFGYAVNPTGRKWEQIFFINYQLSLGGVGLRKEEVKLMVPETPGFKETALAIARMFIAPDDIGTPEGAVTLRGAYNFQTPPGWDTVFSGVLNLVSRPVAPVLVTRVETDWYVHDSEFRYVLTPGDMITVSHNLPIGQAFFVPREDITFRDGSEQDMEARRIASKAFFDEKATHKVKTPYGMEYSPLYQRKSREQRKHREPQEAEPGTADKDDSQ
ncbi:MAG: hypothetical protein LBF16_01735 [Pseudomonadales bacterium]|jgi:hypothetical protein|nr:hypothetical protein [Pseudomonadales bacterium]